MKGVLRDQKDRYGTLRAFAEALACAAGGSVDLPDGANLRRGAPRADARAGPLGERVVRKGLTVTLHSVAVFLLL